MIKGFPGNQTLKNGKHERIKIQREGDALSRQKRSLLNKKKIKQKVEEVNKLGR